MSNNRRHVHSFSGTTRISDNHRHGFSGRTGVNLAPNSSGRHRHRYNVRTARVDEHRHRLINTTGLSINMVEADIFIDQVSGHLLVMMVTGTATASLPGGISV
jgi:hypothetical protein